MSASTEGINDNRQNVEHCHDDKHLAIAKGSNQGACNAAAYTDADIIRTQEGGVCTAAAFRRSNGHCHGLQSGFQSAKAKASQYSGKQIGRQIGAQAHQQEGNQHGKITGISKDTLDKMCKQIGIWDMTKGYDGLVRDYLIKVKVGH